MLWSKIDVTLCLLCFCQLLSPTIAAPRVIIVGAGTAGITTARYLLDFTDFEVAVLEANPTRYGGRIWTYYVPGQEYSNMPLELGAMWIHCSRDQRQPVQKYFREKNIPLVDHTFGENELKLFMGSSNDLMQNISREQYGAFLAPVEEGMTTLNDVSAAFTQNPQWPDMPIMDAVQSEISTREYFQSLPAYARQIIIWGQENEMGARMEQLSARYFDGNNANDSLNFRCGYDKITTAGYRTFLDGLIQTGKNTQQVNIQLGKRVTAVSVENNGVLVQTDRGERISADYVIVTVPLGVLKSGAIQFNPNLPREQQEAIQRIGYGNFVKFVIVFDRVFWPNSTDYFTFFPSNASLGTSLWSTSIINMYRLYRVPALAGMLNGIYADMADTMTDMQLQNIVIAILQTIFPNFYQASPQIRHFVRTSWRNDPLFLGTYTFPQVGATTQDGYNVRRTLQDRVYFAGEHTVMPEDINGYVHGAFYSGYRTAKALMQRTGYSMPPDPISTAMPTATCNIVFVLGIMLAAIVQ